MRSLPRPLAAAIALAALIAPVAFASTPALAAEAPTVRINEVESNGDATDWIELINTGAQPADVSGWVLRDNKDGNVVLPAGTTIAAGGYLAVDVDVKGLPGEFGLGKDDSASVFAADGTTLIDTYSWTQHAAVTFGRCPDGTGEFRDTVTSSKAAANICELSPIAAVRINEVESSGGAPGDWIELINIGNASVDASGLILRDNKDASTFVVPAGTTIAAGGFYVADVEASFGLGGEDAARVFSADGATLIDSYSWAAHAAFSYGRCPDGVGAFATTASVTRGAANDCVQVALPTVRINEVESNQGVPGDWAEFYNFGTNPVDVSGWIMRDNDDSHSYALPAGTVIAAGGYYVVEEAAFGKGLGAADSVRLFLSDGVSVVDSRSWTSHATTTYGYCGADFVTTTSSTKGAANDCSSPVRINEVESNGGTPGDWVELKNNGSTAQDISGYIVRDNKDDSTFVVPAGTSIAAGGYYIAEVDALFGLGAADSARLFEPNGTTLVDSYSWTAHAAVTYGRCPDGTGEFAATTASTKSATNACAGDLVTVPWPGAATVATADPAGVLGGNMSGLAYESTTGADVLWAAKNGAGTLHRLVSTGTTWAPDTANGWGNGKPLHYTDGTGDVDAEGVALTSAGAQGGIFIASERNNAVSGVSRPAVLRYDVTGAGASLTATREWNLVTDLPSVAPNSGLEAIAWIPDAWLVAEGFLDEKTGSAYAPATYPGHGDGLFFVGLEGNGTIYAYALDQSSNSFTRVATIASGFTGVMDLEFEAETGNFWAVCDDTCQGRSAVLEVGSNGKFAVASVIERPTGMPNINNEGFAIAPQELCVQGSKPVFWADDSNTDNHAVRVGAINCTVIGGPTEPTTPKPVPSESLTDATRGTVTVPSTAKAGETITVSLGNGFVGDKVDTWLHSVPTHLATSTVAAAGTVRVTIPTTAALGTHRLAVVAADGTLIGWGDIRITAASTAGLASTGLDVGLPIAASVLLLVAGAALMIARRRRSA